MKRSAIFLVMLVVCRPLLCAQPGGYTVPSEVPAHVSCSRTSELSTTTRSALADAFAQWNTGRTRSGARTQAAAYTLPVVFHIVADDPDLISDADILGALQLLNDAFAHTNSFNRGTGVNTGIQFCLAQTAPDGGITAGIDRIKSDYGDFDYDLEDEKLKRQSYWDPDRYLNIWVVNSIQSELIRNYSGRRGWTRIPLGGYATMPVNTTSQLEGVVVGGLDAATLAHECGHYLGLLHTFEGMNCTNNDCTRDGDQVCDTPPEATITDSQSCTRPDNSCGTDTLSNRSQGYFPRDVADMISNFMDYGNDACKSDFTRGQSDRMAFMIETYRNGLYIGNPTNNNQVCDKPCGDNISNSFTYDNRHPTTATPVNFTGRAAGASNFEWRVNNIVVSTSLNMTYTFAEEGMHVVTFRAFNTPTCFASYTLPVKVGCGVDARFYPDKRLIASKAPADKFLDNVTFTNRSFGASSYRWTIQNNLGLPEAQFTDEHLTYVFREPGNYIITLEASAGGCTDKSEAFHLTVVDPTMDLQGNLTQVYCIDDDSLYVDFYIYNTGYDTMNVGTPVSFYDRDPAGAIPATLLFTYNLPDTVFGRDTGESFRIVIPAKQRKLDQVYMVVNDDGSGPLPLRWPRTNVNMLSDNSVYPPSGYDELNYTFNMSTQSGFAFRAILQPDLATVCAGSTYNLNPTVRNGPVQRQEWTPAGNFSCTNCLQTIATVNEDFTASLYLTNRYNCLDTVKISFITLVADVVVSDPAPVCVGSQPPELTGFVTGTGLKWYTTPTGGTGNAAAPIVDTSREGFYEYWVSATSGTCESERKKITAQVRNSISPPTVTPPGSYCKDTDAVPLTNFVAGSDLRWYQDAVAVVGSPDAPAMITSTAGVFETWITQSQGGCESEKVKLSYTIIESVPPPLVEVIAPICAGQSAPDFVTFVNGEQLAWYDTETSITGTSQPPLASTDQPGLYHVWVTQTLNGCESPRVGVPFEILPAPQPPAAIGDLIFCEGTTVSPLGAYMQGSDLTWYDTDTGGIGYSQSPVVGTSVAGTATHWVTQTRDGCESARVQVAYLVHEKPQPPLVNGPIQLCTGQPAPDVASEVQGENVLWYMEETSGSGSIAAPSLTADVAGTFNFWVTQTLLGCESNRAKVSFIVGSVLGPPTVTMPGDICVGEPLPDLGAAVRGSNLLWYDSSEASTGSPSLPLPFNDQPGTFETWVTQSAGTCESSKAHIFYTVHPVPAAPVAISGSVYCLGASLPPLEQFVTGDNLIWYNDEHATSGTEIAPTPAGNIEGVFKYWVAQVQNCESPRVELWYEVRGNTPRPLVTPPQDICQFAPAPDLKTFVEGINLIWYNGKTEHAPLTILPTIDSDRPGNYTFWVSQKPEDCESERSEISIRVLPRPDPPVPVPSPSACVGDPPVDVATWLDGGDLKWYPAQGNANASSQAPILGTSTPAYYPFRVSRTLDGCESEIVNFAGHVIDIQVDANGPFSIDEGDKISLESVVAVQPAGISHSIQWFDASHELIATHEPFDVTPDNTTSFLVQARAMQCTATDMVTVTVFHRVFPAAIFSPNGDGLNDTWFIRNIDRYPLATVTVYNRWGTIVMQTSHYDNSWTGHIHGTELPFATYYFSIDLSEYNQLPLTGSVTIMK